MRSWLAGACLAAALGQAGGAFPAEIATPDGRVRGAADDGALAFKGIPYAAPPVGALRWRAPQPVRAWSDVRDATAFGPDCMQVQFPGDLAPLRTTPSEDCLYLNVWRPVGNDHDLPVLVWIHGGGYLNGGSSPAVYSGAPIARQGVVFVSLNYRLGRFGSFAIGPLARENADGGLLNNYGFLDQIAALRWVRRNIAAFGGDPARVTLEGESAGGMSVHALLTSPLADGLFRAAVIQSGGDGHTLISSVADATRAGDAFARSVGIAPDDPAALGKLRALPAATVRGELEMGWLFDPPPGPRTWSSPVADGTIAVDAATAYATGRFARVQVMVGATSADLGGPDGPMMLGATQVARQIAAHGVPVFPFRFAYVADAAARAGATGAGHASDVPFFLGTVPVAYGARATDRDLAAQRLANGYLVNFVERGDPNGDGLPHWPAGRTLELDTTGGARLEP